MAWLVFTACAAVAAILLIRQGQRDADDGAAVPVWDNFPATDDPVGFSLPSLTTWALPGDGYTPLAVDNGPEQLPSFMASVMGTINAAPQAFGEAIGLSAAPSPDSADANVKAFLDMIAFAEGTSGPNGYRTMFGGKLFDSFATHPNVLTPFTNKRGEQLKSSAAGRYQFLKRTWDELAKALALADFSPPNQDAAAIELIRRRGALKDVQAGRIQTAVTKIAPIWASMPGAGYAQPEKKLTTLVAKYSAAGGNLEA